METGNIYNEATHCMVPKPLPDLAGFDENVETNKSHRSLVSTSSNNFLLADLGVDGTFESLKLINLVGVVERFGVAAEGGVASKDLGGVLRILREIGESSKLTGTNACLVFFFGVSAIAA